MFNFLNFKRVFCFTALGLFLVSFGFSTIVFSANNPPKEGKSISVEITTPDGVPANVALAGKTTFFAAKGPSGTVSTTVLDLPFGAYRVEAKPVTFNGRYYTATTSQPEIPVGIGQDKDGNLMVQYALADSAQDFHATKIGKTSVSLAWTAPEKYKIKIDRTDGLDPVSAPGQGADVEIDGNAAVDSGLQPGTQYTYSLFTQYRGKWVGPMVLHVSTTNTNESLQTTYTIAPNALLLAQEDIVSVEATGEGVHVILGGAVETPLIGAAVVLPVLPSLAGGFLGIVAEVSTDGRELDLAAGGLSDVFDYYSVNIPDISAGSLGFADAQTASDFTAASTNRQSRMEPPTAARAFGISAWPPQMAVSSFLPSSLQQCLGGSTSQDISFDPSFAFAGHFDLVIDKYNILGADIPKGASLDMAVKTTVSGAASIKATEQFICGLQLTPVLVTIVPAPVPISLGFFPVAEFSVNGTQEISNLGVAVTTGFETAGYIGIPEGGHFTADTILTAVPLEPNYTTNATVGLELGGQIIIGPGVGTVNAGVIAGVSGEFDPVDVTVDPFYMDKVCLETKAEAAFDLSVTAKAWIGSFEANESIQIMNSSVAYPGSPWYFPGGCQNSVPNPDKDLLGPGVIKVDEGTVNGSPAQWNHADNLSPGNTAWILSTGNAANVIGVPSQFASADMGGAGDSALSALSGRATHDAASYAITLVPAGSKLHVKYVFASEEYPEYVGSIFNDVMAVFVDGVNCAFVPSTNIPVSVNTINDHTNASYYVNNGAGAAGYNTTMDGLTVPLTCSVQVVPGVPVNVKIAVADASDHIFDSAVALLDEGIWSSD